jgi:chromate transport protein ChrA
MTKTLGPSLPSWALWALAALGLLGLYFGVSGIVMTGSFAVAGPAATSDATLAHWKHVQLWFDLLAVCSLALVVACAASLGRRMVRSRKAPTSDVAA